MQDMVYNSSNKDMIGLSSGEDIKKKRIVEVSCDIEDALAYDSSSTPTSPVSLDSVKSCKGKRMGPETPLPYLIRPFIKLSEDDDGLDLYNEYVASYIDTDGLSEEEVEENYIILDNTEMCFDPNEVGFLTSYKTKLRKAFAATLGLKGHSRAQVRATSADLDAELGQENGNDESKLEDSVSCQSDWEVV